MPTLRIFAGSAAQDWALLQSARHLTPRHLVQRVLASRSAVEGGRKLVTVLFCDIANSTPLAARLGTDAMHTC
jgi:class 3 adenylate cyclase